MLCDDPDLLADPAVIVTSLDIGAEITCQLGLDGNVLMLIDTGKNGGIVVPTDVGLPTPRSAQTV